MRTRTLLARAIGAILGLLLALATQAGASSVGIQQKTDCTTIVNPSAGKTYCFDETAKTLKMYDGATWRTIGTSRENLFLGTDYGVVGGGVTNDYTAIQAAVTAAAPTHGTVVLAGAATSYLCTGTITGGSNVTILLLGASWTGTCTSSTINAVAIKDGWIEFDRGTSAAVRIRSGDAGLHIQSPDASMQTYVSSMPKGNLGTTLTDAAISVGTATLTSAAASFAAGDVGKYIVVRGAGAGGADLYSTIDARSDAHTVTLHNNAGTSVTGATAIYNVATSAADFRVFGTDFEADGTNYESFDIESYMQARPGYWIKTRQGGSGLHRTVAFQVGGHNLLEYDTAGHLSLSPASGTGAYDWIFGDLAAGDVTLGQNGRSLFDGKADKSGNYHLIGGDSSNRVRIDSSGGTIAAGTGPTVITNAIGTVRVAALDGPPVKRCSYTPGDTTPSVAGCTALFVANSSPTSITTLDDAVDGQTIVLKFADNKSTITRAHAYLAGGVDYTSTAGATLTLIYDGSLAAFYEVCRASGT